MIRPPIRLVLVDDDPLVRDHLTAILADSPEIDVVARAADVIEAVDAVHRHHPEVMFLDVRMPGVDGVTGLEAILRADAGLAIAMLTTFGDEEYVRGALAGGAVGFLLKTDSPAELVRAVPALAAGGAVFSPRVARWLVRQESVERHRQTRQALAAVDGLSARQRQLLSRLATGASNQQIAAELSLTEGTVKQYLSALFVDLGVENRVQAAVLAHAAGTT